MDVKFTFWMQRNPRTLLVAVAFDSPHLKCIDTFNKYIFVILRSYFRAAYQLILKGVKLSKRMFD